MAGGVSRYRIGCTGWGYDEWREAGFYPPGAAAGEFLERYARVFPLAEVDATYYAAPSREQVARWAAATPAGFTFTVKLPGSITHQAALRGAEDAFEAFLRAANFTRWKDEAALREFLALVPAPYRVAVELRHHGWWRPETYRLLEAHGASLVWSVNQYADTPPVVTADFLYARFIGDRALTRFDGIQRDKTEEMRRWRDRFETEGAAAREVFVLLNNHYMGYAPATAVRMQEVLGLPPADLTAAARDRAQRALGDYL